MVSSRASCTSSTAVGRVEERAVRVAAVVDEEDGHVHDVVREALHGSRGCKYVSMWHEGGYVRGMRGCTYKWDTHHHMHARWAGAAV